MNTHEWPRCIKSARQKKRLVKTDRDKQLIQLYKRRKELWQQQDLLPPVPLAHPYQRGWKRFFVLRDDIKRSPKADFHDALLNKINTIQHHHDRSFKFKKRRKKRYGYKMREQKLREINRYDWDVNRLKLTDDEKTCFTRVEFMNTHRRPDVKYVITQPWRYVPKIAPHMVAHTQALEVDIERELSHIANHIDKHNLAPRIDLLTRGRGYNWHRWYYEPLKYINKLKNMPRYAGKAAYLELET